MRLGDSLSDSTIEALDPYAFRSGRFRDTHPRCGAYELERRQVMDESAPPFPERAFHWVCLAVERPDPEVA